MAQHDDAPDGCTAVLRVEIFKFNPARDCVLRPAEMCEACRRTVTLVSMFHEIAVCHECAQGWYWSASPPLGFDDGDACGPFETPGEALQDAKRTADLVLPRDSKPDA